MGVREWFLRPVIESIDTLRRILMASVDELNAAIEGQYAAILPALDEQANELRSVREQLAAGASPAQLAETLARVNASTNRIIGAVRGVVEDPQTPEPGPSTPPVPEELPEAPVELDGDDVE